MTLNVSEIPPEDHDEKLQEMEKCEFVLNYFYKSPVAHLVFVDSYNAKKKIVKCINSNGQIDPYVRVPIQEILNLYKVTCTAVEALRSKRNGNIAAPYI